MDSSAGTASASTAGSAGTASASSSGSAGTARAERSAGWREGRRPGAASAGAPEGPLGSRGRSRRSPAAAGRPRRRTRTRARALGGRWAARGGRDRPRRAGGHPRRFGLVGDRWDRRRGWVQSGRGRGAQGRQGQRIGFQRRQRRGFRHGDVGGLFGRLQRDRRRGRGGRRGDGDRLGSDRLGSDRLDGDRLGGGRRKRHALIDGGRRRRGRFGGVEFGRSWSRGRAGPQGRPRRLRTAAASSDRTVWLGAGASWALGSPSWIRVTGGDAGTSAGARAGLASRPSSATSRRGRSGCLGDSGSGEGSLGTGGRPAADVGSVLGRQFAGRQADRLTLVVALATGGRGLRGRDGGVLGGRGGDGGGPTMPRRGRSGRGFAGRA